MSAEQDRSANAARPVGDRISDHGDPGVLSVLTEKPAFVFVTPSLQISGGNLEIIKLAGDLQQRGHPVRLVAMWRAPHPIDTRGVPVSTLFNWSFDRRRAFFQMPVLMAAFTRTLRRLHQQEQRPAKPRIVFSHFTTYPLAFGVARERRWFFVQDTEWNFAGPGRYRRALHRFIVSNLRRGSIVTTNTYLSQALMGEGLSIASRLPIWANPDFAGDRDAVRTFDVVLMLRQGAHKRADLVIALIKRCRAARPHLRLAAITPDPILADAVSRDVQMCLLRPSLHDMRDLYARSRVFLLMSEHEGFGLPPLEAMGSGCVPVCRDSGGVRSYMWGELADNIVPLSATIDELLDRVEAVMDDPDHWRRLSQLSSEAFDQGVATYEGRLNDPASSAFVTRACP